MGKLLKTAIRMKGSLVKKSFDRATKCPEAAQRKLLLSILRENQETEYGKEHGFSRITDADAFARTVPINTFSDLAPYVERMKNGKRNILTADQPLMFNLTSGTTDKPKFLPVTQRGMVLTSGVSNQWLYRALHDHPSFLDHSSFLISGAPIEGRTQSGVPFGSASGMMAKALPRVLHRSFVLPLALSEIKDYALRYYLIARIALEKEISFIATPNPTTLTKIVETGIQHQEEIVRSIRDGVIFSKRPLDFSPEDSAIVDIINDGLRPSPARADFLQQVLDSDGRLAPSACWKELKLIGCWLGGTIGYQAEKLSAYFDKDIPRRDLGYLASEGLITIPYQDNTPAGILALHNNFYEFIPEGESVSPGTRFLRCHELEQGKRYKIILTNHNGLYRYDIHDVIEVDGFYNRTPVVVFLRKSDDMLNITGEKLHVNHFLNAFKRVKDRHNVSVTQFRAVPNYEMLRYEILLHVGFGPSKEVLRKTILPSIDRFLSEANIEYEGKRKSERLNPPCIHVMDQSWEEGVRKHSLNAGCRDIQYKWRSVTTEISDLDARHIQYTVQM